MLKEINQCPSITDDRIELAIDTLIDNRKNMDNAMFAANIWRVKAELAAKERHLDTAIDALEKQLTSRRPVQTAKNRHQCGFSRTRCPHDRDKLSAPNRQIYSSERLNLYITDGKRAR